MRRSTLKRVGVAVAVVGVTAVSLIAWARFNQSSTGSGQFPLQFQVREWPIEIRPNPLPGVVPNAQLLEVMGAVRPYFPRSGLAARVPMTLVVHGAKLWGPEAKFGPTVLGLQTIQPLNGSDLFDCLLDHRAFSRIAQYESTGMLFRSPYGIRAVAATDSMHGSVDTSTHFGKTCQVCGEQGIPSTRTVYPAEGPPGTLADILRDDAARLLTGCEPEFIAAGLSLYADRCKSWPNRFGQPVGFDLLAKILLDAAPSVGTCDGIAKIYGLVTLMRADEQSDLLTPEVRSAARSYLTRWSRQLEKVQQPDGAWGWSWGRAENETSDRQPMPFRSELMGKVLATGHHLEWMALAPPDCRPSEESIRMAVLFLVRSWPSIKSELSSDWHYYALVSHAARALWLFSGRRDISVFWS